MQKLTVEIRKAENGYFYSVFAESMAHLENFISCRSVYETTSHEVIDKILALFDKEENGEESTT
jgi:hypothetical protein